MFDYCRFDCLASVVWLGKVAEPLLFVCGLLSGYILVLVLV